MNVTETIRTFLEFFGDRGHQVVPGSSLVPPKGDPVLFTTAGMHPLTRYLEGRPHPQGRRLVGVQRCLRTSDLDEVGDDRHLTVFQMLGSWSLGDYDGPQSLRWGLDLLTDRLGIGRDRLHATVFGGDEQVGADLLSWQTWTELGVPVEQLGSDNWWSNGPTGLCGPDSELFVWTGDDPPRGTPGSDERWMELWNHVTLSYWRHDDRSLEPLPQRSVDTGMGLERLLMVVQGQHSVFDCDIFQPWMASLTGLWQPDRRSLRLLSDHLRSSIVTIGDGITPSNTGRGYVLRRLLRRALTVLWRPDSTRTLDDLPMSLVEQTLTQFGQLEESGVVREVLRGEEHRFAELLTRGRKVLAQLGPNRPLTEADLRYLHQTHGLPPELVTELLDLRVVGQEAAQAARRERNPASMLVINILVRRRWLDRAVLLAGTAAPPPAWEDHQVDPLRAVRRAPVPHQAEGPAPARGSRAGLRGVHQGHPGGAIRRRTEARRIRSGPGRLARQPAAAEVLARERQETVRGGMRTRPGRRGP